VNELLSIFTRLFKKNPENAESINFFGYRLNDLQSEFYSRYRNRSAVVVAPTGKGKTLCLFIAASRFLNAGQRVVYIAPTRAILRQKFEEEAVPLFGREVVGLKTGDDHEVDDVVAFTFTTPESFLIGLRKRMAWAEADAIVIDEAHFVFDSTRGKWIDAVIGYALYKKIPLILATATVENPKKLAKAIRGQLFYYNKESSIKIYHEKVTATDEKKLSALENILKKHNKDVCLIFVPTIRTGLELQRVLCVPFHYSFLSKEERKRIETGFGKEYKTIIATTTLAYGVNTPADVVIIYGTRRGGYYLHPFEVRQMAGRAGRHPKNTGYVYLIGDIYELADRPTYIKPISGLNETVISELCRRDLLPKQLPVKSLFGNKKNALSCIGHLAKTGLLNRVDNTWRLSPEGRIVASYLLSLDRYCMYKQIANLLEDNYESAAVLLAVLTGARTYITKDISKIVQQNLTRFQILEAKVGHLPVNEAALIYTIACGNYSREVLNRINISEMTKWVLALKKIKENLGIDLKGIDKIVDIVEIIAKLKSNSTTGIESLSLDKEEQGILEIFENTIEKVKTL
jgi:superfamily II DNA or RNA helicase